MKKMISILFSIFSFAAISAQNPMAADTVIVLTPVKSKNDNLIISKANLMKVTTLVISGDKYKVTGYSISFQAKGSLYAMSASGNRIATQLKEALGVNASKIFIDQIKLGDLPDFKLSFVITIQ